MGLRPFVIAFAAAAAAFPAGCTPPPSGDGGRPAGHPTEMPGLHNLLRMRDDLWSGSSPEGDDGFRSLRELGIRTIVSVDGATPEVNRARACGLRYVHLPLGYGGVTRDQAVRLAKAAADLPGPLYVHCHHGKHRGPTAAALMCRSRMDGWSADEAHAFLITAGTDPRYEGLYAALREFRPPSAEELAGVKVEFPEVAEIGGLAARMVEVQDTWDQLKQAPFEARATLAVQLVEHYREAARLPEVRARPNTFQTLRAEAECGAHELESAIRSGDITRSAAAADRCAQQCTACHRDFRDR
ncbi:MAG TPA: cytochrome c [Gemmataceae bacterium]|nr:cytochrome c [Gemmataceae bacterium]